MSSCLSMPYVPEHDSSSDRLLCWSLLSDWVRMSEHASHVLDVRQPVIYKCLSMCTVQEHFWSLQILKYRSLLLWHA